MSKQKKNSKKRVGIVGTGFIATGFLKVVVNAPDVAVSRVLTRRDIRSCKGFPEKRLLTNSIAQLVDSSDIVVECSGDPIYATEVIHQAFLAKKPVVTMDTEFHVTTGSYFVGKGVLTEAEGDQPGCQAALHEEVTAMGFEPIVYGNVKGFHNSNPTLEEMKFWSKKQGISLAMVTSATDGTKLQYEQALVANGFGTTIVQDEMLGFKAEDPAEEAFKFIKYAQKIKKPITDYMVSAKSPIRVFVIAKGDPRQKHALEYFKMGSGPYYFFYKSSILCHLEIIKTVRRILNNGPVLLDNSKTPTVGMAAIAKRDIRKGQVIDHIKSVFDIRGIAVKIKDNPKHVPHGLLSQVILRRNVGAGQIIGWDDVEISETLALKAWRAIASKVLNKKIKV